MNNQVLFEYDKKNDQYIVSGRFGKNLSNYIHRNLFNKNRLKLMFNSFRPDKMVFYSFFALEVKEIMKRVLLETSVIGVNLRTIQNLVETLETKTWLYEQDEDNKSEILDYGVLDTMFNYKIRDWAAHTFNDYVKFKSHFKLNGYVLDSDPGTGKTVLSLMLAMMKHKDRVIIVCPNNAVDTVWVKTLTEKVAMKDKQSVYIVNGKNKVPYHDERFIVCNNEALKRLDVLVPVLSECDTMVIVDESHNFTDAKSEQTRLLTNFIKDIDTDDTILMSGTTIKGKVDELAVILNILDPKMTDVVRNRFVKLYSKPSKTLDTILPLRYSLYRSKISKEGLNLAPLLKEFITIKMKTGKRYTLDSIKKDMISYTEKRKLELEKKKPEYDNTYGMLIGKAKQAYLMDGNTEESFNEYVMDIQTISMAYSRGNLLDAKDEIKRTKLFEKEIIKPYLDKDEKIVFADTIGVIKYPMLKIQGEVLGRVVLKARINCHRDMALYVNYGNILESTNKKALIFSSYKDVLDSALRKITHEGYTAVKVYGKDTKNLSSTIRYFTEDKNVNPLLATYAALSASVPVTAANVGIFIDLPFREFTLNQAISRMRRDGQDQQVKAYMLRLDTGKEPNINDRNVDIIEWYRKEVERITGIPSGLDISYTEESIKEKESDKNLESIIKGFAMESGISVPSTYHIASTTIENSAQDILENW